MLTQEMLAILMTAIAILYTEGRGIGIAVASSSVHPSS